MTEPTGTTPEPTADELTDWLRAFDRQSLWGAEDVLGSLNFITEEGVLRAMSSVVSGERVSCSREIGFGPGRAAGEGAGRLHFMERSGEGAPDEGEEFAADWIGLPVHGLGITHLDAHAHVFWNGELYNHRSARDVSTATGAAFGGVAPAAERGIVTRGVLLDVAAYRQEHGSPAEGAMGIRELLAVEAASGSRVERGDAVLVRFGAGHDEAKGHPGLAPSCIPWLFEREVAVLATDTGTDASPSGYPGFTAPVHTVSMVAMGLWIIDNCDLELLAASCRTSARTTFAFFAAALRLKRSTGSPINPIAIV